MHFPSLISYKACVLGLVFALYPLASLAQSGFSYFVINEPMLDTQWTNGVANPVQWTKGLLDGITAVDVELARLSTDGLIFVAMNVPAASSSLNIVLQDVPPADDYYLLFINSTHGLMYSISPRFTILAANSTASNVTSPIASAATVTVSGGPNPTLSFATTFPAIANGVLGWRAGSTWSYHAAGFVSVTTACFLSAVWTLL